MSENYWELEGGKDRYLAGKYVEENLNRMRTETQTLDLPASAYLTENFSDANCKVRQRTVGGYKNTRQDWVKRFQ
jgi:hypothetical protein